jgi:hypothetical protein
VPTILVEVKVVGTLRFAHPTRFSHQRRIPLR